MRLLGALFFVFVSVALGQDLESNMFCIERLEMPLYPPLAERARISGTVTATVDVATDGSVRTTMSRGTNQILAPAVGIALQSSKFRQDCRGRSVQLIFNFVLADKLDPQKQPQRVSFSFPNRFWISVPPRVITDAP